MLPALRTVLLVMMLSQGAAALAANGLSTLPPPGQRTDQAHRGEWVQKAPPAEPAAPRQPIARTAALIAAERAKAQAAGVQAASPALPVQTPAEPAARGAAAHPARPPVATPPSSPWQAWQPPLAAAVLMLVIAFRRQGVGS